MKNVKGTNLTIMVRDMDKAVKFYEDLGLTLQQRWGNHYAMISAPGITLGLHPTNAEPPSQPPHMSVGFLVDSLDDPTATLEKMGVEYKTAEDKAGDFLNFQDHDGTPLYFMKTKY